MKSMRIPVMPGRVQYTGQGLLMNKRLFMQLALLLFLSMPIAAFGAAVRADDLAAEQMSVRELMRLDTEQALKIAKNTLRDDGAAAGGIDGGARYAASGTLKLVAIYGVGKKLLAEVMIGTQPYVYMRGQALPVGVKASSSAYMLRGISGACVQLERKDEAHTLCLYPSLWTAR